MGYIWVSLCADLLETFGSWNSRPWQIQNLQSGCLNLNPRTQSSCTARKAALNKLKTWCFSYGDQAVWQHCVLFRLSADWMKPTHIVIVSFPYLSPLIQFLLSSETVFKKTHSVWFNQLSTTPCPVRLTDKNSSTSRTTSCWILFHCIAVYCHTKHLVPVQTLRWT